MFSILAKKNNKNLHNLKYENLITYPNNEIKKISKFIKIKFTKKMIYPTIIGNKYYGNNSRKKLNYLNKTNISNWKNRITETETRIIEFYLSDLMKKFGYKNFYKNTKVNNYAYSKFYDLVKKNFFYKNSIK